MKIYISGPITGKPRCKVYDAFYEAACLILDAKHTPVNPIDIAAWDLTWSTYMNIAMDVIRPEEIDVIYMLDGWDESKGARLERALAIQRGVPVLYQMKRDREKYGGVK